MRVIAIDTTRHSEVGPHEVVGGLTLFERCTRMAARAGAERALVISDAALPSVESPRLELVDAETVPDDVEVLRSDVIYELHGNGLDPIAEIATERDRREVEQRLWDGCRKPVDGLVSRHLNRHVSLFVSRRIAHTAVMPNHVTAVTFGLGVLAAVFAAIGGTAAWAIAGVLFQLTSVLDGVDGELARVRMDGSVMGEWLDTISDDSSDVLMYAALGVGAWRSLYSVELVEPTLWLALGVGAAVGKLCSMGIYYRWLRSRGRGDLLAFEWAFDDETNDSAWARVLAGLRYLTKNDFIAFTVMLLGLGGVLPWFLLLALPGTWIVAFAAFTQSRSASQMEIE